MTNEKLTKKKRKQLRKEYSEFPKHMNKLKWCSDNAFELGMSYGSFVSWLAI